MATAATTTGAGTGSRGYQDFSARKVGVFLRTC